MTDDEEDRAFGQQFVALREAAVHLLEGFEERLRVRLDEADRHRGPSIAMMISSALVELMNVTARMAGYTDDPEPRPESSVDDP